MVYAASNHISMYPGRHFFNSFTLNIMTELKHTPGPWIYDPNDRQDLLVKQGSNIVCEVIDNRAFTLQQCQANAKLIAAAPDLLKAAIAARDHLKQYCFGDNQERTDVYNAILKAIDKATK